MKILTTVAAVMLLASPALAQSTSESAKQVPGQSPNAEGEKTDCANTPAGCADMSNGSMATGSGMSSDMTTGSTTTGGGAMDSNMSGAGTDTSGQAGASSDETTTPSGGRVPGQSSAN